MASMGYSSSRSSSRLLLSVCLYLLISLASANLKKSHLGASAITPQSKLHIAYLGRIVHSTSGPFTQALTVSHHNSILSTVFMSPAAAQKSLVYNYKQSFSGFAAHLTAEQASTLRDHPDVISVFESETRPLATTFSWDYLGFNSSSNNAWNQANFGDGVIIGLLDTGVWPESKSYSDTGLGPIPSRWKGSCDKEDGVVCNKKLIGAKVFLKSTGSNESVRDIEGHGTHTSSTAGGSPVPNASFFGIAQGTAVGGAPKARIAMYKVCTEGGCSDADILAAFDEAIADGVDIVSVSLGGSPSKPLFEDSIVIGSFHALEKNILVAASAGNSGRSARTVTNSAPWILTVAASTIPREFVTTIDLGNGKEVQGGLSMNLVTQNRTSYPLVTGSSCKDIEAKTVGGKIAFCNYSLGLDGELSDAGAAGYIGILDVVGLDSYLYDLPTSIVSTGQAANITSYINSTKNPAAHIRKTAAAYNLRSAPEVARFSSRGPAVQTPQILKPDLTAPGVQILAAWPPKTPVSDSLYSDFNIISGTSMSCPHVAGAAAIIKAIHPTWSPQAIKSALMTTATPLDVSLDGNQLQGFAFGAGQINPNLAADPGLVYDAGVEDHALFLCEIGLNTTSVRLIAGSNFSCPQERTRRDLNYPSISFVGNGTINIQRTVTNVGPASSVYTLSEWETDGASLSVVPQLLRFTSQGQQLSFTVTADLSTMDEEFGFGYFVWTDWHGHKVRSAVAYISDNGKK